MFKGAVLADTVVLARMLWELEKKDLPFFLLTVSYTIITSSLIREAAKKNIINIFFLAASLK